MDSRDPRFGLLIWSKSFQLWAMELWGIIACALACIGGRALEQDREVLRKRLGKEGWLQKRSHLRPFTSVYVFVVLWRCTAVAYLRMLAQVWENKVYYKKPVLVLWLDFHAHTSRFHSCYSAIVSFGQLRWQEMEPFWTSYVGMISSTLKSLRPCAMIGSIGLGLPCCADWAGQGPCFTWLCLGEMDRSQDLGSSNNMIRVRP